MSASTGRQFYHNNPHSPPRSPLSPLYPPNFNPAIRFGNNRLSTYSDVSIHDLSDFCEDELDDYLPQDSSANLVPQNQQLDKLYGGILDSQQWNFTSKPKTDSVEYDLGEWSKTSAMILSDPPKRKYLLDTATVTEPTPPLAHVVSKVPEPTYSEKPKQAEEVGGDMSKAPSHAISFAHPDFFSHQEKVVQTYGDEEEDDRKSFYRKNRVVIISASILFVVLAIILIVLGATGSFTPERRNVVSSNGNSQAMSQHEGWEETKQVEQIADVAPGFWSGDHLEWVDDSVPFTLDMPSEPSIAPPVESAPVAPVEPVVPAVPASLPVVPVVPEATTIIPAASTVTAFSLSGEGEGTFYSPGVGLGACGNQHSDTELVAALNIPQFGAFINPSNSPACGACVNITGPKGSVQVKIVDKCPGCKQGDIDLSPAAFEKVADFDDGRVKITWTPC